MYICTSCTVRYLRHSHEDNILYAERLVHRPSNTSPVKTDKAVLRVLLSLFLFLFSRQFRAASWYTALLQARNSCAEPRNARSQTHWSVDTGLVESTGVSVRSPDYTIRVCNSLAAIGRRSDRKLSWLFALPGLSTWRTLFPS